MNREDCWYNSVCVNECSNNCLRYIEMKYLMDNSDIPQSKQIPAQLIPEKIDKDSFRQLSELKNDIVDFVKSGASIYIWGAHTGNGKTSWAIKLLLKYFDEIWAGNGFNVRGVFVHVPTFLIKSKDFKNNDQAFEELKRKILV